MTYFLAITRIIKRVVIQRVVRNNYYNNKRHWVKGRGSVSQEVGFYLKIMAVVRRGNGRCILICQKWIGKIEPSRRFRRNESFAVVECSIFKCPVSYGNNTLRQPASELLQQLLVPFISRRYMAVSWTKEKISFHTESRLQIKEKFHVYDDITIAAYSNNKTNNRKRNIAV